MTDQFVDTISPVELFHRARELLDLGELEAAQTVVNAGLDLQPKSEWGTILKHNILKSSGDIPAAVDCLHQFITRHASQASDGIRALLVDQAAEAGLFELAITTNESRSRFSLRPAAHLAVALQCFAKSGTLERTLRALARCRTAHDFKLFILQDALNGSTKSDIYAEGHARVRQLITSAFPELSDRFHSVTLLQNRENMGTTASCRRLLDEVTEQVDAFIFLEDDCILAPDALEWARFHLENTVSSQSILIGACESIFFDARGKTPTPEQIAALTAIARRPDHRWAHTLQDFVPSTCFFTKSEIWNEIASIRSFPRGDRNLSMYLRARGGHCIMPVVPRAADIGMLDEMGYSVNTLGRSSVIETKNTYVSSLDEKADVARMTLFKGQLGQLFDASVNLSEDAINCISRQQ